MKIECAAAQDYLKGLSDGIVDLTVTSPPYDELRKYNGYSFPFEEIAAELFRVTKQGGVVVWVVGDQTKNGTESGSSFRQALFFMSVGFNLHDTMIWKKANPLPTTPVRYSDEFEYMFVFSKGKPNTFNPIMVQSKRAGEKQNWNSRNHESKVWKKENTVIAVRDTKLKGNVWTISVGGRLPEAGGHPAIFPEKLAADHIHSWTNPGDLVLDPFSGSGTTAKMALEYGRDFLGCDISQEYCDIANRRIAQIISQPKLFQA